ncbi:MAG: hypothetical protein AB1801_12845 [Chloroflexota bacterium]
MNETKNRSTRSGARTVLDKIREYSYKIEVWRHRARKAVFGFRSPASVPIDRWSLPVKLLQRHRILERRQAFQQAGGTRSSIIQYALKKARLGRK